MRETVVLWHARGALTASLSPNGLLTDFPRIAYSLVGEPVYIEGVEHRVVRGIDRMLYLKKGSESA